MIYIAILIAIVLIYSQISKKNKLYSYYFSSFKSVKERLLNGSEVDTKKKLEDYEDRLELYMHLDGYNGAEILEMKVKAKSEVFQERQSKKI
jgi:hypothetical protein